MKKTDMYPLIIVPHPHLRPSGAESLLLAACLGGVGGTRTPDLGNANAAL